jgi:hypothetical protein
MGGGWAYVAAAWLASFLAIGGYAWWLHRSLKRAEADREDGS